MPMDKSQSAKADSISLTIPVLAYNERYLIAESLQRLEALEGEAHLSSLGVIVIDDGVNRRHLLGAQELCAPARYGSESKNSLALPAP